MSGWDEIEAASPSVSTSAAPESSGSAWDEIEAASQSPTSTGNRVSEDVKALPESIAYPIAAARGLTRDIPFAQDIGAAINAGRTYVGGTPAGVPTQGTFGERFSAAKKEQEAVDEALSQQYPGTTYGSQIAGAFALPMAGPATRVASSLEPMVGAGLARAAGSGAVGAGYGAAYGLGSGDTVSDRLHNAGAGALVGGVGGAAIPAIIGGAGSAARMGLEKLGFGNAEDIAARNLSKAYSGSVAGGMSPEQVMAAEQTGQPVLPIDVGGQGVRQLAKTAGQVSPDARDAIISELSARKASQSSRLKEFAEQNLTNGLSLDDPTIAEGIKTAASAANGPAYAAAMAKGAGGVWSSRLQQLINHPWVKSAIPQALDESNAAAINSGQPAMRNPFVTDANGNLTLPTGPNGQPIRPTLEFWDTVKKNIDGTIRQAQSTPTDRGDPNTVRIGTQLKNALMGELDNSSVNPGANEYKAARAGAGRYLGEENAYDFGPKFLNATKDKDILAGQQAINKFTPEEQQYAAHGYLAQRIRQYQGTADNLDLSNKFLSPTMKAKDQAILGPDKAAQLEAYLLREGIMNRSLTAMGGSDTAPNLLAMAKGAFSAHGGGMGVGAAVGAGEAIRENGMDPAAITKGLVVGAAGGALASRVSGLSGKVANETVKQLLSDDPTVWRQAIGAVAQQPQTLQALRQVHTGMGALAASVAASQHPMSLEYMPQQQRASGGRVSKRDYPAKRASHIEKLAKRNHEHLADELRPLMSAPDNVIADALRLAQH